MINKQANEITNLSSYVMEMWNTLSHVGWALLKWLLKHDRALLHLSCVDTNVLSLLNMRTKNKYRSQPGIRLCIQIERIARVLFWQPKRWWQQVRTGGLLVLQLVHLSSPVLFCACTLKQGPYVWRNWHSASFEVVKSVVTQRKDWFCKFCRDMLMWPVYETTSKLTGRQELTFRR